MLGSLGLRVDRLQVESLGHRTQHDALLGHRQGCTQAAPGSAAERDPLVRPGLGNSIDEEGIRLGRDFLTRAFARAIV